MLGAGRLALLSDGPRASGSRPALAAAATAVAGLCTGLYLLAAAGGGGSSAAAAWLLWARAVLWLMTCLVTLRWHRGGAVVWRWLEVGAQVAIVLLARPLVLAVIYRSA